MLPQRQFYHNWMAFWHWIKYREWRCRLFWVEKMFSLDYQLALARVLEKQKHTAGNMRLKLPTNNLSCDGNQKLVPTDSVHQHHLPLCWTIPLSMPCLQALTKSGECKQQRSDDGGITLPLKDRKERLNFTKRLQCCDFRGRMETPSAWQNICRHMAMRCSVLVLLNAVSIFIITAHFHLCLLM